MKDFSFEDMASFDFDGSDGCSNADEHLAHLYRERETYPAPIVEPDIEPDAFLEMQYEDRYIAEEDY